MSYLEFYTTNIINNKNGDNIKGACNLMCPKIEIAMRIKEKMVHVLEVTESGRKLIKCYSRSAADSTLAVSHLLRPYPALMDTVHYLLLNITKRQDVPISVVYDFINDRLRSVRQDMTIQRLPPNECKELLEPMIRFYVYYGYMLCELPQKNYDPFLNKKYLLECLKWFLSCCDQLETLQKNKLQEINEKISNLDINDQVKLTCDRELMESLYLLCNVEDIHPLYRYLSLPKHIKCHHKVKLAYKISLANLGGNYVRVTRLMKRLCPLTVCALNVYMPILQRNALQVMSVAYNRSRVPTPVVTDWLLLEGTKEAIELCTRFRLTADEQVVSFARLQFAATDSVNPPKKLRVIKDKLKFDIDYIFTYQS